MGREASKASSNVWYQARIRAAEYDGRLRSREGAAELLGMSVSAVADAELGLSKVMPVDKAVQMAELYNAPQLLNWYCINECPIGRDMPLSDAVRDISQVAVRLVGSLRPEQLESVKNRLLEIADDGKVTDDEAASLAEIMDWFDDITLRISELRILCRSILSRRDGTHG